MNKILKWHWKTVIAHSESVKNPLKIIDKKTFGESYKSTIISELGFENKKIYIKLI